jgi:hypothetical protein
LAGLGDKVRLVSVLHQHTDFAGYAVGYCARKDGKPCLKLLRRLRMVVFWVGALGCLVEVTDISEMFCAFIVNAMVEAASTSERRYATTQKTLIFISP